MGRVLAVICAAILLFAGAVWFSQRRPPPEAGFSGLEFAALSPAASARTPMLAKGAVIESVESDSPADKAGIAAGEVVAAIDGRLVISARQASDMIRRYRAGQRVSLTLYDVTEGEVKPQRVTIVMAEAPDPKKTKKYSVDPPRTLAKEIFALPPIAANSAWSLRLSRGAFIKPMELTGMGAGRCNGLAPDKWRIVGYAPDGSLFHVMAPASFEHAVLMRVPLQGEAEETIRGVLERMFGAPARLSAPMAQPFGFRRADFGNVRGGAGFVVWRIQGDALQLWIAAVAAAESGWALPSTAAVLFSLNCAAGTAPHDPAMATTSVSAGCLAGRCQDSDLAAAPLTALRLGYVHDPEGRNYLINPRRDLWASGAQGPGYYHQVNGQNEKLEPGRTN